MPPCLALRLWAGKQRISKPSSRHDRYNDTDSAARHRFTAEVVAALSIWNNPQTTDIPMQPVQPTSRRPLYRALRWGRIAVSVASLSVLTGGLSFCGMSIPAVAAVLARVQLLPAVATFAVAIFIGWLAVTLVFGRIYCSTVCPFRHAAGYSLARRPLSGPVAGLPLQSPYAGAALRCARGGAHQPHGRIHDSAFDS